VYLKWVAAVQVLRDHPESKTRGVEEEEEEKEERRGREGRGLRRKI
jgi:hypothetical protein